MTMLSLLVLLIAVAFAVARNIARGRKPWHGRAVQAAMVVILLFGAHLGLTIGGERTWITATQPVLVYARFPMVGSESDVTVDAAGDLHALVWTRGAPAVTLNMFNISFLSDGRLKRSTPKVRVEPVGQDRVTMDGQEPVAISGVAEAVTRAMLREESAWEPDVLRPDVVEASGRIAAQLARGFSEPVDLAGVGDAVPGVDVARLRLNVVKLPHVTACLTGHPQAENILMGLLGFAATVWVWVSEHREPKGTGSPKVP